MAKEFAASGASVALLARKQDALTAAKAEVQKAAGKANIKIEAYSCDVAKAARSPTPSRRSKPSSARSTSS